jgi:hypothetical protein
MSDEKQTTGLGWRYNEEECSLSFLLEAMIAVDEGGNPAPAGIDVKIGPLTKQPTIKQIEKLRDAMVNGEIAEFPIEDAKPVSWEYYCEQGYNEEE